MGSVLKFLLLIVLWYLDIVLWPTLQWQAPTIAGAGANGSLGGLGDQNYFWNQVLKPLEKRLLLPVQSESLKALIHQDETRFAIVPSWESIIGNIESLWLFPNFHWLFCFISMGIFMGNQVTTVHTLFALMQSVMQGWPKLIRAAHIYNLVVELE